MTYNTDMNLFITKSQGLLGQDRPPAISQKISADKMQKPVFLALSVK